MSKKPAQTQLKHFYKQDNAYIPTPEITLLNKLVPGMYSVSMTMQGEIYFTEMDHNSDDIVELPDPAYTQIVSDLESFMDPDTRKRFESKGFIYKRSSLLFGSPGTGKTVLVNRIAKKVIDNGGTVLFNPDPRHLKSAFAILDSVQLGTMVMVIFEELDELLKTHESNLLNILDGEIQKSNIIYMATTNHIDQIPLRIRRPGRFSTTMEVKFPTAEAREVYLTTKLDLEPKDLANWIELTDGFSVDELSETVRANYCLQQPLLEVIDRIRLSKGDATKDAPSEDDDDDDEWKDEERDSIKSYYLKSNG